MPDFSLERGLGAGRGRRIIGIDEAGRGPWAGPVVAAAAWLGPGTAAAVLERLEDSKKLKPAAREEIFARMMREAAVLCGVGEASVEEIDDGNILQASLTAMSRAALDLARIMTRAPDAALVDGNRLPPLDCPATAVIKGDGKSLSIAAASIVAKVTRDRRMARLAVDHPGYGWERNQGYGTAEHLAALDRLGVTAHHRRSFRPIRERLEAGSGPSR
jgi:ribonuclease HII